MRKIDKILGSPEFAKFFKHAKDETLPAMMDSAFVVSIAPDEKDVDVKIAMEIGLCLLLDKPLILLADIDRKVPRRLLLIADHIVHGDMTTPAGRAIALEKLAEKLKEIGVVS